VLANGPAASNPSWLAFDRSGNLLISDSGYYEILRLNLSTGAFDVLAGHFARHSTAMEFLPPAARSAPGRSRSRSIRQATCTWPVAEQYRIRRVDAVTGVISTVAGDGAARPPAGRFSGEQYPHQPQGSRSPGRQPALF
jgi:hypothetical protein